MRRLQGLGGCLLLLCWGTSLVAAPMTYSIDPEASRIVVQVQREGVFSLLAHDHVLVARQIQGRIILDRQDPGASQLSVRVPVSAIDVDPPEMREALHLVGELTEQDRSEIRENMLAPDQLAGESYPEISATLQGIAGGWPEFQLSVRVRIRESVQTLSIPVKLEFQQERLVATGAFALLQRDFGIEPYRTLLGAIAVGNEVRIHFNISARAGS